MRTLCLERVPTMGGAGDPPALVGDSPTGMGEAITTKAMPGSAKNHLAIPSGGSPNGTGESPVLPLMTFSCALLAGFLTVTLNAADPPAKVVNDGYGDFMLVPAGAFKMGDNFGDGESRERPVHVVDLDAYYIGKFEVTNGEWRKFRDDPGYSDPKFWPGGRVMSKEQIPYWTQRQNHGGALPDNDDFPVLGVNWDAATAYCKWLSAKTGKSYRLPTEAEWEKAARGTDQRKFPWGNSIDRSYANYVGSQTFDTGQRVGYYDGSKRGDFQTHNGASPYGVHDMAGNVMEWCQDWYSRDYYSISPKKNPKGPETGAYRVVRGGTFFMEAQDQRTYLRSALWPSVQTHRMTGFRAVREP